MTCPNSDRLMADSKPKPSQSLAARAAGKERGSDKTGKQAMLMGGVGDRQGGLGHAGSSSISAIWAGTLIPARPRQSSQSPAGLASRGRSRPCKVEHCSPLEDSGSALQRKARKLEPDMLRISRGMVGVFHTELVIYSLLREFTLKLGSSNNPPRGKLQERGQRVQWGASLPWPGTYESLNTPSRHMCLVREASPTPM